MWHYAHVLPNLTKHLAIRLVPKSRNRNADGLTLQEIVPAIHEIRGQRVVLDAELGRIYGVPVKALNQGNQAKR